MKKVKKKKRLKRTERVTKPPFPVQALIPQPLKDPKKIAKYLNIIFKRDQNLFLKTIGQLFKASRGMSKVSKQAHLSRSALYRVLNPKGDPKLSRLSAILKILKVRLVLKADQ